MQSSGKGAKASPWILFFLLLSLLCSPRCLIAADDYWAACNRHPDLASADFDGCFQPYLEAYGFTRDYAQERNPSTGEYFCQARKFVAYYRGTQESSGSGSNSARIDILYYVYPEEAAAQFQKMRADITGRIGSADPEKVLYSLSSDTEAGYLGPGGPCYSGSYVMLRGNAYASVSLAAYCSAEYWIEEGFMQAIACAREILGRNPAAPGDDTGAKTLSGTVTNAWGEELPGMPVTLAYAGREYTSITDENGKYSLPFDGAFGKKARLSVLMLLQPDPEAGPYLVFSHNDKDPVQFVTEFTLRDGSDLTQNCVIHWLQAARTGATHSICITPGRCREFTSRDLLVGLEYYGYAYMRFGEAAAAFEEIFPIDINPDPVYIKLGVNDTKEAYYVPAGSLLPDGSRVQVDFIGISQNFFALNFSSLDLSDDAWQQLKADEIIHIGWNSRPREVEYHEYAHHMMKVLYGKHPPNPDSAFVAEHQTVEARNHDGYINPSTADSFVEGFAIFMAQVISSLTGDALAGVDSYFGPLEVNYRAWDGGGRREDMAVAGIFWDLFDGVDAGDDDTVQLTLEQIAAVVKTYHPHMYSVYQGFVAAYPDKKAGIDRIFISHGFFADTDEGNGVPDPGEPFRRRTDYFIDLADPVRWEGEHETVGQATNYQRPWRYYPPPTPNHFIKTASAWPLYTVSISFPDFPALDHEMLVVAQDGMLPVAVPPPHYRSSITIQGFGSRVATPSPLTVTGQEFYARYGETIEQGYFAEHDFGITAAAPAMPVVAPELLDMLRPACAAGSLLGHSDPRLDTLRRFRDEVLAQSSAGRALIRAWYAGSRQAIDLFERHAILKKAALRVLDGIMPIIEAY